MAVAQFTARELEAADEEEVLQLLGKALGEGPAGGRTANFWRWKHVNNCFGPSYARVACDDSGNIIGMRAFMQWELISGDKTLRAVRAVDTATHPNYRRTGIFSTLTQKVLDDVTADGVDLVFNTPNNSVLPGYLKLGWQKVANVRPMVKVLSYPGFAAGMVRRNLGKTSPRQHEMAEFFRGESTPVTALRERQTAVERLIQRNEDASRHQGIRTKRSWDYLQWRYLDHPTIPYWTVFLEEAGELQACAIFRTNTRFGMKEVVLGELLLSEPNQDMCVDLLKSIRSTVNAHYLIAHFQEGSLVRRALDTVGFRVMPGHGMNFASRTLGHDLPQDPFQFDSWDLTLGDLELF